MVLDEYCAFGSEFYSGGQFCHYVPVSDKCIVSMVLALAANRGCALVGGPCVGKAETVKVCLANRISHRYVYVINRNQCCLSAKTNLMK